MIFHCFGWFVRWKEESKAVTQKFEQTVNELRWEFFVFCLVILWKMQKPIMTLSSCKAMKDFHSNLKFTSVALGHLRTSYQTFPNFDSSLLSHLIAWLLIAWLFQFTALTIIKRWCYRMPGRMVARASRFWSAVIAVNLYDRTLQV